MKREHPIRTLLGLTQDEIAMLLGVSRAHWSMFESGRRSLPATATALLADLIAQVKPADHARTVPELSTKQYAAQQHKLDRLLRKNNVRLLRIDLKIAAVEKKILIDTTRSQLAKRFENRKAEVAEHEKLAHRLVLHKMQQQHRIDPTVALMQLEIKQQTLLYEQKLLESRLQELYPGKQ